MKCLFCYNQKLKLYRSNEFIIRTLTDEQLDYLSNLGEEILNKEKYCGPIKNNSSKTWTRFFGGIFAVLGAAFIAGMIFSKKGFENIINEMLWVFILSIISFIIGITLLLIDFYVKKRKEKTLIEYDETDDNFDVDADYAVEQSNIQLGVPSNAFDIDIIGVDFKDDSDNDEDIQSKNFIGFTNDDYYVFIEDGKLCFSDCYDVVGIPLSSITEIVEVEENLLLPNWHKKEDYKSNEYKEYNIHKTIKGIVIPSYIKVILNINNCAYYFSVPNYEADKLRKLINK